MRPARPETHVWKSDRPIRFANTPIGRGRPMKKSSNFFNSTDRSLIIPKMVCKSGSIGIALKIPDSPCWRKVKLRKWASRCSCLILKSCGQANAALTSAVCALIESPVTDTVVCRRRPSMPSCSQCVPNRPPWEDAPLKN
jgi:hypothetical protein